MAPSWPGLSRPSTSFFAAKTWMPGTSPGMTRQGDTAMHAPSPTPAAPIRAITYAEPRVLHETRPDGAMILRAAAPLGAYDPSLARLFRAAVETAPTRVFLAERGPDAGDWRRLTYAQARTQ